MQRPKSGPGSDPVAVVIYETPADRDHVLKLSPPLELPSEFDWAAFRSIENGTVGEAFFQKAAGAQALIVAARSEGDFSPRLKSWLDRWAFKRANAKGILIGLFADRKTTNLPTTKELFLRQMAHQGGVEYRSRLEPAGNVPDSLESYSERAGQVTTVLDNILKNRPTAPPPL